MITDLHHDVSAQLSLAKMRYDDLEKAYDYVSRRFGLTIKEICELSAQFDMHEELLRDGHYD
tara:strand:+ start:546 stop:731 length:186 start_codon:yes stop_codon:yes gene_type:complete